MLRSPTRPPAPRVKASSTSPFDTFFRFLRDQKPAVPRSADSTGCQELDTVPCFVRSTYDDCTRPTHPGPGEGDTAGKIATRHAAHPRVDPIDQASRKLHPVRQAGSSIQSGKQEAPSSQASRKFHPGTHCLRFLKQTFDRQVRRKKNSLGFLGIPRKKSDSRKFISVFSRDSTY